MTDLKFTRKLERMDLNLAHIVSITVALAIVGANPALIAVRVQSREPPIQRLLEIIQVLGLAVALSLSRARVSSREALVSIQARAGSEPSIVATNGRNCVIV